MDNVDINTTSKQTDVRPSDFLYRLLQNIDGQ